MNPLKALWYRIVSSDNGPLLKTIKEQKTSIENRDKEILRANKTIEERNTEVSQLKATNEKIVKELQEVTKEVADDTKHSSLENYKRWLDANVKPISKFYDFGKGSRRVHTIFKDSLKDEGIIRTFTKDDLGFDGSKYASADNMVYSFNVMLSKKYPTRSFYKFDKDLYGRNEYWATAKETINNIRNNKTYGDCDDSMTLRYSCLYYLLRDHFPKDIWRLRGFIVDIWTSGGHALLGWVKEGANNWIPIETTFYDTRQRDIWNKEYEIENQMLYQIRYSFDNITEYAKN